MILFAHQTNEIIDLRTKKHLLCSKTLVDDMHSSSNHFNPASMACVRKAADRLDASYALTSVSSKSSTTCEFPFTQNTTNSYWASLTYFTHWLPTERP